MTLFEMEIEFLKVFALGLFFGWTGFRLFGTRVQKENYVREVTQFRFMGLNKPKLLKNKRP